MFGGQTGKDKWLRISQIANMKMESIKLQIKAADWDVGSNKITLALCIIKWGGVLTPAGFHQCKDFAPIFRNMVLKTNNDKLSQLNFLQNTQCYHTEEVRVRKTAKSFVNALFDDLVDANGNGINETKGTNVNIKEMCQEGRYVQKMLDDISDAKSLIELSKFEIQKIFYNPERREYLIQNFDDFNNEKLKQRKIKNKLKKAQRKSMKMTVSTSPDNSATASASQTPQPPNPNAINTDSNSNANKINKNTKERESDEILYFDDTSRHSQSYSKSSTIPTAMVAALPASSSTTTTTTIKNGNNNNTNNNNNASSSVTVSTNVIGVNSNGLNASVESNMSNGSGNENIQNVASPNIFDSANSVASQSDSTLLHKSDIDISFMRYNFSTTTVGSMNTTNTTNTTNTKLSAPSTITTGTGQAESKASTEMTENTNDDDVGSGVDHKAEVSSLTSENHESLLPWTQRSLFLLQDPIEKCRQLFKYIVLMRDTLVALKKKQDGMSKDEDNIDKKTNGQDENKNESKNDENEEKEETDSVKPYLDESLEVMIQRWDKIIDELYDSNTDKFDCSKIPDVFDSCRYDLLHNRHLFSGFDEKSDKYESFSKGNETGQGDNKIDTKDSKSISARCMKFLRDIWHYTELLSAFVIPQEYGFTKRMKKSISNKICQNLFLDIKKNILNHCINDVIKNEDNNDNDSKNNNCELNQFEKRCFLYFTSESYLHSLRNALILSDIPHNKYVLADIEGMECSYFSHGVIRVFEDIDPNLKFDKGNKDPLDRFYVEVQFSPGAHADPLVETDDRDVIPVVPCGPLCGRYPLKNFLKFLEKKPLNSTTNGYGYDVNVNNSITPVGSVSNPGVM